MTVRMVTPTPSPRPYHSPPSLRGAKKPTTSSEMPLPGTQHARSSMGVAYEGWRKSTAIHGLSHARDTEERWARAMWMVVFLVGAGVTIWQVKRVSIWFHQNEKLI